MFEPYMFVFLQTRVQGKIGCHRGATLEMIDVTPLQISP